MLKILLLPDYMVKMMNTLEQKARELGWDRDGDQVYRARGDQVEQAASWAHAVNLEAGVVLDTMTRALLDDLVLDAVTEEGLEKAFKLRFDEETGMYDACFMDQQTSLGFETEAAFEAELPAIVAYCFERTRPLDASISKPGVMPTAERYLVVDGVAESGLFDGGGEYPPFVVFDVDAQENIAGPYVTRDAAEAARTNILAGVPPVLHSEVMKTLIEIIDGVELDLDRAMQVEVSQFLANPRVASFEGQVIRSNGDIVADVIAGQRVVARVARGMYVPVEVIGAIPHGASILDGAVNPNLKHWEVRHLSSELQGQIVPWEAKDLFHNIALAKAYDEKLFDSELDFDL